MVVLKKIIEEAYQAKYSHLIEIAMQIDSSVSIFLSGFLYDKLGFLILTGVGGCLMIIAGFIIWFSIVLEGNSETKIFSIINNYRAFIKKNTGFVRQKRKR